MIKLSSHRNRRWSLYFISTSMFISIVFAACVFDITDNKLKVYNDTGKTFFVIAKKDTLLTLNDVKYLDENARFEIVKQGDTCFPLFAFKNHGGYVKKINEECLDSTVFLYAFSLDKVKKCGWDSIVKEKKAEIRQGFKVIDLDSLKWLIKLNDFLN